MLWSDLDEMTLGLAPHERRILPQGLCAPAADADAAPEELGIRDGVETAFHLADVRGERYEWWLGRVLGLFRKSMGKWFTLISTASRSPSRSTTSRWSRRGTAD